MFDILQKHKFLMKYFSLLFTLLLCLQIQAQKNPSLYEGVPVFHGAKITGCYPGTDFLFTVPATGERPILFYAENLPVGLKIDNATGLITGMVSKAAEYKVRIKATNKAGRADEELKIVIGDKLCLTPAMGWNSWNVFTNTLDEKLVIETADAMVSTGMRDLGYQYINMDDYWHALSRDADGKPVANAEKFPHGIKWLSDYVHSKGLKLGIYSDAGDKTCGKCFGGFQHEEIDAKVYAEWGVDLLKYDFCFVPFKKSEALARYKKMGDALKGSGRSIVYSLCNWGFFKPWEWGESVGGNYWRTTPDIVDVWKGSPFWYGSFMSIMKRQTKLDKYAGPGHWNDPDMMTVGNYGKGKATGGGGKYKGMNDIEYQTHMSMWCMLNAPLLSSCDLRNMNEPTKNILLNPEILAINQDAKGEQAKLISKTGGVWLYKKNLSDGSVAVTVFNTTKQEKKYDLQPSVLNLNGTYVTRDVWEHTEAGILKDKMQLTLKAHETIVLKMESK